MLFVQGGKMLFTSYMVPGVFKRGTVEIKAPSFLSRLLTRYATISPSPPDVKPEVIYCYYLYQIRSVICVQIL